MPFTSYPHRRANFIADSLHSGIHREDAIVPEVIRGKGAERTQAVVVERAAGQGQSLGLLHQRRDDARVAVSLVHGGVRGEKVKVGVSLDVVHPGACWG